MRRRISVLLEKNPREELRSLAAQALRANGLPMHNKAILSFVESRVNLPPNLTRKRLNTLLHDDPASRFIRVGPGTWRLRDTK
jgi:hypothetical protein